MEVQRDEAQKRVTMNIYTYTIFLHAKSNYLSSFTFTVMKRIYLKMKRGNPSPRHGCILP